MTWREFLHGVTGGDGLAEAALQEFAGYCVLADNRHGVLLGVAGPVEEVCLVVSALVDLVGIERVLQIGYSFMDVPAERVRLRDRALAFSSDWGEIAASPWFWPALSGGIVVAENGCGPVRFIPRCKFVFASERVDHFQTLPREVREKLFALQLHALERPLGRCLRVALMAERPAIRDWAAEGLERLLSRGGFAPGVLGQR